MVLVILSVVLLIAALSISRIRSRATSVTSESNLRQLGVLVVAYSQDFREMPPTVFAPIEQFMSRLDPPQAVQTPHGVARGYWFSNSLEFAAVLDNVPPARIRRDASMPRGLAETGIDGFDTDFKISDTLYATPEYWNRITQRGIEQWFPMQLSLVSFPSDKGFMRQVRLHSPPPDEPVSETCCSTRARSAVLWFDLAAESLTQRDLIPGEPNFWHYGNLTPLPLWASGTPIDSTLDGVFGRDR